MDSRIDHDRDFHAWTRKQARLLREAARQRTNAPIDWENIAEELDGMGHQVRDAIQSHLATVIEHLLKLEHSPDPYPRRKWRPSVDKARRHLARTLERHPSLKGWPETVLNEMRGRMAATTPCRTTASPRPPCPVPARTRWSRSATGRGGRKTATAFPTEHPCPITYRFPPAAGLRPDDR